MRNSLRLRKRAYASMLMLASWLTQRDTSAVYGSDFSSGRLTGPLLVMCEIAMIIFIIGIVLTYLVPRIAPITGLLASFLSLPLLLYFIAPGTFRTLFQGEVSVSFEANSVWTIWALETAIAILVVMAMSVWNLSWFCRHKILNTTSTMTDDS